MDTMSDLEDAGRCLQFVVDGLHVTCVYLLHRIFSDINIKGGIGLMSYIEVACHVFVSTHAMQKNRMIQDHET